MQVRLANRLFFNLKRQGFDTDKYFEALVHRMHEKKKGMEHCCVDVLPVVFNALFEAHPTEGLFTGLFFTDTLPNWVSRVVGRTASAVTLSLHAAYLGLARGLPLHLPLPLPLHLTLHGWARQSLRAVAIAAPFTSHPTDRSPTVPQVGLAALFSPFLSPVFYRGPDLPPVWLRAPFLCPCAPVPWARWWALTYDADEACECISFTPLGLLLLLLTSNLIRSWTNIWMRFCGVAALDCSRRFNVLRTWGDLLRSNSWPFVSQEWA